MTVKYEKKKMDEGYAHVIGCDEVGRGCLAGPVVAAAVAFAPASLKFKAESYKGIKDSKLLLPEKREVLSKFIKENFLWSIGEVSQDIIDKINIHNASLLAMRKAIGSLLNTIPSDPSLEPGEPRNLFYSDVNRFLRSSDALARNDKVFLYVDGKFPVPQLDIEQEAVVEGDNKILSVAAASIIAKVYRDNLMKKFHEQYPAYNFAQHKGYATLFHRTIIKRQGLSPIHRYSFCEHLI